MDPAAGRGRGADRPRAGLLAGASPGAVGARGLRRHMAGCRVLEIGLLRARPTQCPSQKLDVSTAEGHTMTLEPASLSSGFVTQFSPSPTWPAGQSLICAHHQCKWDPLFLRPGSVGGTGEGRGEGARPRGG